MKTKPLCPILLIGFPSPEKGERDLRRCTNECALYDEDKDQCSIKSCAEVVNELQDYILDMASGFYPVEDDYSDCFEYDPNTISAAH